MGGIGAKFLRKGPKDTRLIMIGLDSAGKTTILYQLRLGDVVSTIPTIGFNVESITYKEIKFTVWDVGGQDKIRGLWRHYYQNVSGMIFVMDANDRDRLEEASKELSRLLGEEELKNIVLLILANKQDLPNAMDCKELTEYLQMDKCRVPYHVQSCCALNGNGLTEGLEWLSKAIHVKRKRSFRASSE
eukprot:Phypoly_transcript_15032.p1 GENE.Phypoly_transcript_15032~~Phypoly_transcript_15032.p1  ORF type:complete len:188 (+),score=21.38 Phypoly_transcript_15032:252-815(+)